LSFASIRAFRTVSNMGTKGIERLVERRLSARVQMVGTAIVLSPDRYVGTFLIENVSADSALLAGDTQLAVGDRVRVLFQLQGAPRVGVRGTITRCAERNGQHVFALSFQASPAIQEHLQRAALWMLERASPLTLVVEENVEACATLSNELKLLGRNALGVHTPLDAIGWLHAPGVRVEVIAVGSHFADMDGLDFLEFVALDFPTTRRVLVVPSGQEPERAPESVHSVLRRPWSEVALAEAFAAEPSQDRP
jgi:hypothetical protein